MSESEDRRLWKITLMVIAALTVIRIAVLIASPLQLYPDEAQYWFWAQTPDFGYFSKPPLIAWIIAGTTAIFGNGEWAIRLASPFIHAGTALMLFAIGKKVGGAKLGPRLGMWSALAFATLPGVAYSSGLISTDVPLLFCWSVATYAFLRAMDEAGDEVGDEAGWRWPLIAGVAIGYGLLAKYAMLYFVLGAVIAALVSPKARKLVFSWRGLGMLALGFLLLAPNIAWNAVHGFPTIGHTESNADWSHAHFNIMGALDFFGSQFGVFGPVLMVGFLAALWRLARKSSRPEAELVLAALAIPPILLMTVQGFISEANANWAATAYVSATPLAVAALLATPRRWALWASFAIDGLAMAILWVVLVSPATGNALGIGNAFKREEGWRQLGQAVLARADAGNYDAIAVANRSVVAEMTYYARPHAVPLRKWGRTARPTDHFEMTMPLTARDRHVLLVLLPDERRHVLPTFDTIRQIGTSVVKVGGHHTRTALFYDARDHRAVH
jgi:4-amino-4-deoxy-L-arabinose transferase-like glycosyltransferase